MRTPISWMLTVENWIQIPDSWLFETPTNDTWIYGNVFSWVPHPPVCRLWSCLNMICALEFVTVPHHICQVTGAAGLCQFYLARHGKVPLAMAKLPIFHHYCIKYHNVNTNLHSLTPWHSVAVIPDLPIVWCGSYFLILQFTMKPHCTCRTCMNLSPHVTGPCEPFCKCMIIYFLSLKVVVAAVALI
jgi:hypothetical protein